ncbi:MAG: chloride channel protein [Haloarculaceae archaeon]
MQESGTRQDRSDTESTGTLANAVRVGVSPLVPRDQDVRMNLIAIGIGIVAGFGAVAFRLVIWAVQEVFYGDALNPGSVEFDLVAIPNLYDALASLGDWRFVLLPAIGGLVVGIIVALTTPEVRGHGVPKVLEAMLVRGGQIDPTVGLYKALASSIAIASGGALGREGPIVQIGSAAGSFFGRYMDARHTRTLVAAGAAGGIAGTFNAPIAGTMFALEILLAEYYIRHVVAVVLSAVMATAVARPLLAFTPNPGVRAFLVPIDYTLVTPAVELPLFVVLGLLMAVAGAVVVRLLYGVENRFDELPVPGYTKPALGGALLGGSVLAAATVFGVSGHQAATWLFGVGYETIHHSITGELTLAVLVGLALLKALGFSLSVGSGSSGGVFSPTLYVGAMIGGAFGVVAHALVPGVAPSGAYALVGMAGVFAAAARAPLTATLIVFELTGQYTIILPLLVVTVLGSVVADRLLDRGTIYTEKLREKGITVQERRIGSLEDLTAADVMTTPVDTVTTGTDLREVLALFGATGHHGIPIVDEGNRLAGIVVQSDVQRAINTASGTSPTGESGLTAVLERPVEDVGTADVVTTTPTANLLTVVDRMEGENVGRLPVVDGDGVVVGIVTRSDVLDAYDNLPDRFRRRDADATA